MKSKYKSQKMLLRTIAIMLCVCFILLTSLSTYFITTNINHKHNQNGKNESCTTCIEMQTAWNVVKQISLVVFVAGVTAFVMHIADYALKSKFLFLCSVTLINLKVRLNN